MHPDSRHFRFGNYRTPKFKYGQRVFCERRGWVEIVGLTDAPIPWPIGKRGRTKAIVIYGALARAVKRESASAVAFHFGVHTGTVGVWRKALDVRRFNEGTRRLVSLLSGQNEAGIAALYAHMHSPEKAAKIAAAMRGIKRSPETVEKIRRAATGRTASAEARANMSAAQRKRGVYPPAAGKPWTAAEDDAVRTLTPKEAAEKTGRTLRAVIKRRGVLKLPDGRLRWTAEDDELVRTLPPAEVAKRLGRTLSAVRHRRDALGLERLKKPWTANDDRLVLTLSTAEAMKRLGRTRTAVYQRRKVLRKRGE